MDLGACGQRSHSGVSLLFEPSLPAPEQPSHPPFTPPQDCVTHTQAHSTWYSPFLREIVSRLLDKDTQK